MPRWLAPFIRVGGNDFITYIHLLRIAASAVEEVSYEAADRLAFKWSSKEGKA
jgi:hypothetical protein